MIYRLVVEKVCHWFSTSIYFLLENEASLNLLLWGQNEKFLIIFKLIEGTKKKSFFVGSNSKT